MAGIKISDLPAAPSAVLTDVFPVDQGGSVTYKESNQQLLTLFKTNGEALSRTNDTNVTMTLGGTPTTALLNATSMTLGWTGSLAVSRGGTANTTFTAYSVICAGTSATGAFQNVVGLGTAGEQLTSNGPGALPTWQSGTLVTPSALTRVDDTNVTLTLGGTPSTALLQAVSITAGWAGQLSLARGGTNKSITPDNGALVYCDADSFELLAATATAGQIPRSGSNAAPTWSTATYPATAGTGGNILTSDGTNWTSASAAGVGSPLTTKGDIYTFSTVNARLAVGTTNGQILQVASGAATGLAWSTPTYPSASGTAGFILRSDGTNNVYSQATYPDLVGVNTILFGSAANTVGPIAAAQNGVLVSSNTNVPSMLAGPGTTGNVLQSNAAAAPSYSTATYPSTATGTGTVLRANGTNWAASTSTFADTYGASTILYSNGANTVTGLATANSARLGTSSSGVPSMMAANYILSASCGSFSTSSGSLVDVTNLTATITTTGRPVMMVVQGDGNNSGANTIIASSTGSASISFVRDSTALGLLVPVNLPSAVCASVTQVDFPAAGTYTYKVQANSNAGSMSIFNMKLLVMEL